MPKAEYCSFCGRQGHEVAKIVSGPECGICNDCHETMRPLMPEPVPLTPEEREEMNRDLDELLASVPKETA